MTRDEKAAAVDALEKSIDEVTAVYLTDYSGLTVEESDDLLDAVWAHVAKIGQTTWHHRWRPGDLVIWDNRCVNHARTDFSADEPRLLRRYTVSEPE